MGKKNVQTHHHHHHHHHYHNYHHLRSFRSRHVMMSFLLLLLSSSIQLRCFAQGSTVTGLAHTNPKTEERAREAVEQLAIGSSPPSCNRRCRSCIRCMAVQVPVTAQIRSHSVRNVAYYARGDDISNYKPMTWKCKCGDYFFDP